MFTYLFFCQLRKFRYNLDTGSVSVRCVHQVFVSLVGRMLVKAPIDNASDAKVKGPPRESKRPRRKSKRPR